MHIDIEFDQTWHDEFFRKIEDDGPWANWDLFKLAYEIEEHMVIDEFEGLIAPKFLPQLTPLPHQIEAAQTVLEKMNGKAILADEVGLGKTIEAGLILKEYMIRGLVKKVLILAPASLVTQWEAELNQKFFIPAVAQKKSYVWEQCDVVISSIDTAKRDPHREMIYRQNYDMVIIDEAHKLKNNKTKNYEFVQNLKKKFCLLLTATPIQNKVEEIFNLVSLLKPGHLGSQSNFTKSFSAKERSVVNNDYLKELITKVMIRNRRGDTGMEWTKRHIKTVPIQLSKEEKDFYDAVCALKSDPMLNKSQFSLITLQKEVCSSREAAFMTLKNMLQKEETSMQMLTIIRNLMEKASKVKTNAKAEIVLELIKNTSDKFIIFTEYRATQVYLQWFLQQHGITSVPYRGGFNRGKKDWMRDLFKNKVQVLIATEAGGEGINLQFCNRIINYDLPWNPMRIEQRIGRIHRLGQDRDVLIYNFATKGTVEEHILHLLYEKINLFERVVGELDEILTKLEIGNIEKHIEDILFHSDSDGEVRIKMDNLTSIINYSSKSEGKEYIDAAARYS